MLQCTQQEASKILCAAESPVKLLVHSIRMHSYSPRQKKDASQGGSSPGSSASERRTSIHSWYIDEEEDPKLRKTFPNAEGHLFEVTLHRDGKKSLGLLIL